MDLRPTLATLHDDTMVVVNRWWRYLLWCELCADMGALSAAVGELGMANLSIASAICRMCPRFRIHGPELSQIQWIGLSSVTEGGFCEREKLGIAELIRALSSLCETRTKSRILSDFFVVRGIYTELSKMDLTRDLVFTMPVRIVEQKDVARECNLALAKNGYWV